MSRVLDIELFLVRLAPGSATLVSPPRLLFDQSLDEQLENGSLHLESWNSGALAKVLGVACPAVKGVEDLLLGNAQIIVFLGPFALSGPVGGPTAGRQRGLG
jgi:hypothetical protein